MRGRDRQALREKILDASRDIVSREGFAALSMRRIADAIGYSPASLYLHFENRDAIIRTLCAEGYARLLAALEPTARIASPDARLRALCRAYVEFGLSHPQTWRLMFMDNPAWTNAAFAALADENEASGEAARRFVSEAFDAFRAANGKPETVARATRVARAEALWATIHGIVVLRLTCPAYPHAPLEAALDAALDAWLGAPTAGNVARDAPVRARKASRTRRA